VGTWAVACGITHYISLYKRTLICAVRHSKKCPKILLLIGHTKFTSVYTAIYMGGVEYLDTMTKTIAIVGITGVQVSTKALFLPPRSLD
jgi:hypothetical protein